MAAHAHIKAGTRAIRGTRGARQTTIAASAKAPASTPLKAQRAGTQSVATEKASNAATAARSFISPVSSSQGSRHERDFHGGHGACVHHFDGARQPEMTGLDQPLKELPARVVVRDDVLQFEDEPAQIAR